MPRGDAMKARYGGLEGSFGAQLQQFADHTKDDMDYIFRGVMIEMGRSVINLTPVDTGLAKANWQFSVDNPATASVLEKDKGGMETLSKLITSVRNLTFGQTAYLVNNLRYAKSLEYGHSQQAPTGMVRITLARFNEIVAEAVIKVNK